MRYGYVVRSTVLVASIAAGLLVYSSGPERSQAATLQTWPSRTPTPPAGPTPTAPPGTPGGGGSGDGGDGTATAPPPATTAGVTVAPTPVGGFLPTAESCGVPPTVMSPGTVNVRAGPGTNYEIISQLVFLEVRIIVGRAANAPWWLIELADSSTAWVADQAVLVHGYIGYVPLHSEPVTGDATATPGIPWNPTPEPGCPPPPTPTPSSAAATALPSATVAPTGTSQIATPTTSPTVAPVSTREEEPPATQALEAAPTLTPPPTVSAPTAAPIQLAENVSTSGATDSGRPSLLLLAGGGLILAGAAAYVIRSRRGT